MIVRFIYTFFTNIFDTKLQNALYIYKIYTSKDGFTWGAELSLEQDIEQDTSSPFLSTG